MKANKYIVKRSACVVGEQWMNPVYSSLNMVVNVMKKILVLKIVEQHEYNLLSTQVRYMEIICM